MSRAVKPAVRRVADSNRALSARCSCGQLAEGCRIRPLGGGDEHRSGHQQHGRGEEDDLRLEREADQRRLPMASPTMANPKPAQDEDARASWGRFFARRVRCPARARRVSRADAEDRPDRVLARASNVFMTFAWYAHLKNLRATPVVRRRAGRAGASRSSSTCCRCRPTASATRVIDLGAAEDPAGGDHAGGVRAVRGVLHEAAAEARLPVGGAVHGGGVLHVPEVAVRRVAIVAGVVVLGVALLGLRATTARCAEAQCGRSRARASQRPRAPASLVLRSAAEQTPSTSSARTAVRDARRRAEPTLACA